MKKSPETPDEKFVRLWQSHTVTEVAKALGITRSNASMRASKMRKQGVPLRRQKRVVRDIAGLKKLARQK